MISTIETTRSAGHNEIPEQIEAGRISFNIKIFRTLIFLLLLFWCAGFSLISLFPENEALIVLYPPLKKVYSGFCHQDQQKTIFIGEYFLVCSRCSGIYFGALLGSFIAIFLSVQKRSLAVKPGLYSAAPMITDVIFCKTGLYYYSIPAAFFTGVIFGSAVIIYILSLIENNFFYNSKGLI